MADDDAEILPPERSNLPARGNRRTELAEARATAPRRVNPGGIVSSAVMRWEAQRHARTYNALTTRTTSETALVDADTALGHSLIKNARMRHEFDELPRTLAVDRVKREIRRVEEVRDAFHQSEMSESRRTTERTRAETELSDARTSLTKAQERLTTARRGLLDASQALEAQRNHGQRAHDLGWHERIGEREMVVEEQRFLLSEHRKRISDGADREDELLKRRAEMNADGRDTAAVEAALSRTNARKAR